MKIQSPKWVKFCSGGTLPDKSRHPWDTGEGSFCLQQGKDQRSARGPEGRGEREEGREGGWEDSVMEDPEFRSQHCHLSKEQEEVRTGLIRGLNKVI